MGCAPSQSSIDIFVEQQKNILPEEKLSNKVQFSPTSSRSDYFEEKNCFLEEEQEFQDECFLQESIKSSASQISNTSWDSGMYELDDELIITENSEPHKVQEVNNQFVPQDGIELLVQGKACPRKLSPRDREKVAQKVVLNILREEGLTIRPGSKAVGGIRFDFVPAEASLTASLTCPPILKRRKKTELTYEEIEQKLTKAEERRKKKTEEKLRKLNLKDRQEFETIRAQQEEINRQKIEEKLTASLKSREKHLIELRDKLKAREEYASKVRERKKMQESGYKYIMPP